MITNRQKNFFIIFCSKALFLGIGYALLFGFSKNDTWISFILGSLLGIIFCYFLKTIMNKKGHKSLSDILKIMGPLGFIIRLLLIIYSIAVINEILFIIQIFAKSFFLINSTTLLIILPLVILIGVVAFKGYKILAYVVECLFPISLFFTIFGILALFFNGDYTNLKPFFSNSTFNILKSSLYYFTLSATPLLFLLDLQLEDNNFYNAYIIISIALTFLCVILIGVLGPYLIYIYRFPEYMVLKDIQVFGFIEKVENILSISWILDNFVLLCLASCFLKRLLPQKYNNYYFIGILITIFLIACFVFGDNYINDLIISLYFPHYLFLLSIPAVITIFIYYKTKRKQN